MDFWPKFPFYRIPILSRTYCKFFGAPAAREIKVFPLTTVLKVQKCRACSPQIKAFPLYDSVRRRIFSRAYGAQKSSHFPLTTALEI